MEEEDSKDIKSNRWELGACWVQHLQNQSDSKTASEANKVEPHVKGLGKGLLKEIKKQSYDKNIKTEQEVVTNDKSDDSGSKEAAKLDEEMEKVW